MFQYPTMNTRQCECFCRFATILQEENRFFNLTRIVETPQIYLRHFADALQGLPPLDAALSGSTSPELIDVGSGAGLPGIALAIARPRWRILCLDSTGKKVAFQERVIRQLDLSNARALQGRAEALAHESKYRERFDAVVARAVAHLQVLGELCAGFVKIGGVMLAAKGGEVDPEIDQARGTLETVHLELESVLPYSLGELARKMATPLSGEDARFNLLILRKRARLASPYPRAFGIMKKALKKD